VGENPVLLTVTCEPHVIFQCSTLFVSCENRERKVYGLTFSAQLFAALYMYQNSELIFEKL